MSPPDDAPLMSYSQDGKRITLLIDEVIIEEIDEGKKETMRMSGDLVDEITEKRKQFEESDDG